MNLDTAFHRPGRRNDDGPSTVGCSVFAALLALYSCTAMAASPTSGATENVQAAIKAVRTAAELLGVNDRPFESLETDMHGIMIHHYQGRLPEEGLTFRYRWQSHLDWDENRVTVATELGHEGLELDSRNGMVLPAGAEDPRRILATMLSPHAVLGQLLQRPENLMLAPDRDTEQSVAVAGLVEGRLVTLMIATEGSPVSLHVPYDDPVDGDSIRHFEYLDYGPRGDYLVPGKIRRIDNGRLVYDLEVTEFHVDAATPDWTLEFEQSPPSAASAGALEAETLAEGVFVLKWPGGAEYRAMLVELDDGLMLLDAPAAIGDGAELRRLVATLSDKPIRIIVPSHHHIDHTTGVTALLGPGVEVYTTPGNADWFTRVIHSSRWIAGDGDVSARTRIRTLQDEQRIGPVHIIDAGPTDHAGEHLIFHFPEHGILFQSDMVNYNPDGTVPQPRTNTPCTLLSVIEERGLTVDTNVSSHRRTGTVDALRQSVAGSSCAD